jgi:hypothetical protein
MRKVFNFLPTFECAYRRDIVHIRHAETQNIEAGQRHYVEFAWLRIPIIPARDSDLIPATHSDPFPAT